MFGVSEDLEELRSGRPRSWTSRNIVIPRKTSATDLGASPASPWRTADIPSSATIGASEHRARREVLRQVGTSRCASPRRALVAGVEGSRARDRAARTPAARRRLVVRPGPTRGTCSGSSRECPARATPRAARPRNGRGASCPCSSLRCRVALELHGSGRSASSSGRRGRRRRSRLLGGTPPRRPARGPTLGAVRAVVALLGRARVLVEIEGVVRQACMQARQPMQASLSRSTIASGRLWSALTGQIVTHGAASQ